MSTATETEPRSDLDIALAQLDSARGPAGLARLAEAESVDCVPRLAEMLTRDNYFLSGAYVERLWSAALAGSIADRVASADPIAFPADEELAERCATLLGLVVAASWPATNLSAHDFAARIADNFRLAAVRAGKDRTAIAYDQLPTPGPRMEGLLSHLVGGLAARLAHTRYLDERLAAIEPAIEDFHDALTTGIAEAVKAGGGAVKLSAGLVAISDADADDEPGDAEKSLSARADQIRKAISDAGANGRPTRDRSSTGVEGQLDKLRKRSGSRAVPIGASRGPRSPTMPPTATPTPPIAC